MACIGHFDSATVSVDDVTQRIPSWVAVTARATFKVGVKPIFECGTVHNAIYRINAFFKVSCWFVFSIRNCPNKERLQNLGCISTPFPCPILVLSPVLGSGLGSIAQLFSMP